MEFSHPISPRTSEKYDSTFGTKIAVCLTKIGGMMLWIMSGTFKSWWYRFELNQWFSLLKIVDLNQHFRFYHFFINISHFLSKFDCFTSLQILLQLLGTSTSLWCIFIFWTFFIEGAEFNTVFFLNLLLLFTPGFLNLLLLFIFPQFFRCHM